MVEHCHLYHGRSVHCLYRYQSGEDDPRSAACGGRADPSKQVIGTAIAINILIPKIPLVAGCAIAIADCLIILLFYRPDGSLRTLRWFELFVSTFVLAVFISFCIELSLITGTTARHVFDGFLPSREIFVSQG